MKRGGSLNQAPWDLQLSGLISGLIFQRVFQKSPR